MVTPRNLSEDLPDEGCFPHYLLGEIPLRYGVDNLISLAYTPIPGSLTRHHEVVTNLLHYSAANKQCGCESEKHGLEVA